MPSKFNEQIKDEKQKSKFEKTREILYGNRYNNSNFLEKGWYNVRSYFKLKTVEVGEYIRNGNAKVREGAHKFKNSNLYFKAEQASDKVASGAKKAMKVSKRGAKAAAEIAGLAINKVVDKAKEFSEKEGVKKTTSMLKNAAVAAGKRMKTAGIWTKNAAVTAGSFIKKAAIATAKATVAGARAAKNSKYGLKASEAVAYCQRGIKKGATSFKNSKFASGITSIAKKVKSGIAFAGSKTMKGLKAAARKTAEVYGGLKSKWIDYRYEKKYMNSIKKNEIHGMLRDRSGGELYKYNINKFRKDVLASKEVEKNLKLRSNRERIRRNVDAMEKGHTGDVELVEMSSEGTFIKDDPGEGMLQSVNKYDLGNALITEASSKKKKVNLDEVVKDDKAEDYLNGQGIDTKNIPKTVPLDNKNIGKSVAEVSKLQKSAEEIKGKSNEAAKKLKKSPKAAGVVKTATDYAKDAETTLALGKISLP
ncbi:MAG: hypothetical protein K6F97_07445, partial [Lachnospiraceae bacterium]|nr:hypothetical protein [Lachnospiraceae bacterium]